MAVVAAVVVISPDRPRLVLVVRVAVALVEQHQVRREQQEPKIQAVVVAVAVPQEDQAHLAVRVALES